MIYARLGLVAAAAIVVAVATAVAAEAYDLLPDGRSVTPIGFTIPVEGFASSEAMSPDGKWIAVLSQDGGAVDVIAVGEDAHQVDRLATPWASGMTWTKDGLYVTRGYSGAIARYAYDAAASVDGPVFSKRKDLQVGGLVNGVAEDPPTHRLIVARPAEREVVVLDDRSGATVARLKATGQPFAVASAGGTIFATLYDSDHVDAWARGAANPVKIPTGPHPTELLIDGGRLFVANADGHDVAQIDV